MLNRDSKRGFTLVEMSLVMLVAGILLAPALAFYQIYQRGDALRVTYKKVKTIDRNMESFFEQKGRYPCPAAPRLQEADPLAGVEDCTPVTIGVCNAATGICGAGGRATSFGGAGPDPVAVGAVPYKTIRDTVKGLKDADHVSRDTSFDKWHSQMTYAVTEQLTTHDPNLVGRFGDNPGAINVTTETGAALVPANAMWVLISHGKNAVGAYKDNGSIIIPCGGVSRDVDNCAARNAATNVTFVNGLTTLVPAAQYFDDVVHVSKNQVKGLWQPAEDNAAIGSNAATDIVNRNPGNVGVGTTAASPPQQKLDVRGDIRVVQARVPDLCTADGTRCFNPEKLGGAIGMECPPPPPLSPNSSYVMTGIADRSANSPASPCVLVSPPGPGTVITGECPSMGPAANPVTDPRFAVVGVTANGCIICADGSRPGCPI